MPTYKIRIAELASWLATLPDDHPAMPDFARCRDGSFDPLRFLSEIHEPYPSDIGLESFPQFIEDHGIKISDDLDFIYFDPDLAQEIDKVCCQITEEYEGFDAEGNEIPESYGHPTWTRFGLGGDDDVDYCSSYVTAGISMLNEYITEKEVVNE
jgi:hypothetical protein